MGLLSFYLSFTNFSMALLIKVLLIKKSVYLTNVSRTILRVDRDKDITW